MEGKYNLFIKLNPLCKMITHYCAKSSGSSINKESSGLSIYKEGSSIHIYKVDYKNIKFFVMKEDDCIGFIRTKVSCSVEEEQNYFNIMDRERNTSLSLKEQLKKSLGKDNAKTKKVIFIERFGIFPDFQGQGNGRKVFELLKKKFQKTDFFYLYSGSSNSSSELSRKQSAFYTKKCGFIEYQAKKDQGLSFSLYIYDNREKKRNHENKL